MSAPRTHAKMAFLTGRPRVQTKWVWGPYEQRRWAIFSVKLGIFLALPWLTVGGMPALLFDIPNRRYHVFGQIFWPQDFYMLGLILAVAGLLLFATSAMVGRVFCGHACPHTLLTSLFMAIDHLVEGDRPARLALDAGTASPALRARRVLKHAIWVAVSLFLGYTFTGYFVGIRELGQAALTGSLGGWPLASWLGIAGLTYLFAGHLRDFICTTTCPYGKFQGAMQDKSSLLVAYDVTRGEPRGKGPAQIARGGCVDCGLCVTACPMGIDIRNGPQYECITCARCVDACNDTMTRVGAPIDLIRFAAEAPRVAIPAEWPRVTPPAEVPGAAAPAEVPAAMPVKNPEAPAPGSRENRWWRPRLGWYAAVLLTLVGSLAVLVTTRPLLSLDVSRNRNPGITMADGRGANLYALKLLNKDTRPHTLAVELEGVDGQLVVGENPLTLAPGELREVSASVVIGKAARPVPFRFRLIDTETRTVRDIAPAVFLSPS